MVSSSLLHHLCGSENDCGGSQVRAFFTIQLRTGPAAGMQTSVPACGVMGLSCSQVMQEGLLTFVFFKRPTMVHLRRCLCLRVHGSWSSNGTSALALRQGEVLTMVKDNLGPEHRSKLTLSPLQISEFFRCSSCSVKSVLAGLLPPGTATLIMNPVQSRVSTLRLLVLNSLIPHQGLPCFSSSS